MHPEEGNGQKDPKQRMLDLLEATHDFPGNYLLTVVVRSDEKVTADVMAAASAHLAATLPASALTTRPSKGGKYLSLRITIPCESAQQVLDIYARVKDVTGVMTIL